MSRPRRFALSLALFLVGAVVTPAVAGLVVADAGVAPVVSVAVGGSLLVGGVGYALGTDDAAARVGASRFGVALVWFPALIALPLLAAELAGPAAAGRVLVVAAVGVFACFLGGAFAWSAAASEHTARSTAGEDPRATWEARPEATWWRNPRVVVGVGFVAVVACFVLGLTVAPEATSLATLLGGVTGGLLGGTVSARRPRTFRAYPNGVAVESNGTAVFYEWHRIAAVDRTPDAVVLRRERGLPWTRLDARAEELADPDGLAATLRELRG